MAKKSTRKKKVDLNAPPKVRKTKARQIAEMEIGDIISNYATLSRSHSKETAMSYLRATAKTLIGSVRAAVGRIEKGTKKDPGSVFSYAAREYRNTGLKDFEYSLNDDGTLNIKNARKIPTNRQIDSLGYNNLIAEIAKARDFINSATSTREMTKYVQRQEDKRLFGENEETGELNYQMTASQRTKYWTLYNEFMNANPIYNNKQYSGLIQKMLSSMRETDYILNPSNLDALLTRVEREIEELDTQPKFNPGIVNMRRKR